MQRSSRVNTMSMKTLLLLSSCALAVACAKPEVILEGERLPVRPDDIKALETAPTEDGEDGKETAARVATPIKLGVARANTSWTHQNGSASHMTAHPALSYPLNAVWTREIGRGVSKDGRITSEPVVADGVVYTLDAAAKLSAIGVEGSELWSADLTPAGENQLDGFGGGVAVAKGQIFASTGFGEVVALASGDGDIQWRQELDGAVRAAPTVLGDKVYVVARDDKSYGLDAENGRIKWRLQSASGDAGVVGGASPAALGPIVVVPFASGEVVGALARNGRQVWSAAVSGGRRGLARGRISDITGDPVIDGDRVYVANQSGRLVALDRRSGERLWNVRDGSLGPALPVGGSLFYVSDEARLVRLSAEDGSEIWDATLPQYAGSRHRNDAIQHYGPVLAGGRLLVAGSDGELRSFDPASGEMLASWPIPGGAASSPAIANGVLYVLSQSGKLHAFN